MTIGVDEVEAIRLADIEGLYQDAAAERMGISRATYARVLARGREAVARSLIERRLLLVGQGPVIEETDAGSSCPVHGGPRRKGRTCHCAERARDENRRCPCSSCRAGGQACGHKQG